jgi:hypothetical protein
MNAQVKDLRAEHIYGLAQDRAKRNGCRVKKLDQSARDSVINAAAWRLILNQQRFGNIRDYVEQNFWYEKSAARDRLVTKAVDAERKTYVRASKASGSTDAELAFHAACFPTKPGPNLQPLPANSVNDVIEREEFEAEEAAADDAREKIEAEENARLQQAVAVYERKLCRTHREALRLVCGPRLPNGVIAARCSVAERTVARIRADVCDIADGILTLPEDAVETLLREVETLKKEMAVIKAERRRDRFLLNHSPEEFDALRAWAAPFCEALGQSVDELLGATIEPKSSG